MNKQQLMSKLLQIGMSEKEAKLYVALLDKPEMSAGDLHRVSGVARSKIYDILEKMLAKGYCQERIENTRRYFQAVQPSFLEQSLKHRWEADFKSLQQAGKEALGFLQSKFDRIQDGGSSLHLIEILRNVDHIRQRYLSLVNDTKKEILTFNRSPYACEDPKVLKDQQKAASKLLRKGLSLKSIYMWEEDLLPWLEPAMIGLSEVGEEIRISPYLPIKMMVFDQKKVLLALVDIPGESKADFTMVVIEDSGLINSFLLLFQNMWKQAKTFEKWQSKRAKK